MLNTNTLPLTIAIRESVGERLELSRLLAAATVNQDFGNLLINEPQVALEQGYQDENFLLSQDERDLVLSIHAGSLTELAQILVRTLGEREYVRCHYPAHTEQYFLR